jgi:hypothetical protein
MRRYAHALLVLLTAAACGDLGPVPPPPVPLSALDGDPRAAGVDDTWTAPSDAPKVRLVRAAPADALVMVHLPDIAGSIRRFRQTGLHKWLTSPELRNELGAVTEIFSGNLSFGSLPVDAARLAQALPDAHAGRGSRGGERGNRAAVCGDACAFDEP